MSLLFILQAITEIVVPGCDLLFMLQYNEHTKLTNVTEVLRNDSYDSFLMIDNKHGNGLPILDNVNRLLDDC